MTQKKTLNIVDVHITFSLLKQALNVKYVSVEKLAKELSVKTSVLMLFINQNFKLFETAIHKYENKEVLCVLSVFMNEAENPKTKLWLENKIAEMSKYLFVEEYDNYGYISGYFIKPDSGGSMRQELWRNTEEKINSIKTRFDLKEAQYTIGGFGDHSLCRPGGFEITLDQINELKKEGWTFNSFKEISK